MSGSSIVLVASLGEWGFFTGEQPTRTTPLPLDSLPENVRQDFATVHVEGLETSLQFFRVNVAPVLDGEPTIHVVVSAYPPFPPEAIPEVTRQLLPICAPAALCLIVEDQTGWARATSVANGSPLAVAVAVAHTKIVGGWDETDPIVVTVDGEAFQVSGHFQDSRWELAVARAW